MPKTAPTSTTSTSDTAGAENTLGFPRQRGGEADDDGVGSKVQPIPGMKAGWYYRPDTRVILYGSRGDKLTKVGAAPKVTAVVSNLTDDGLSIRIE